MSDRVELQSNPFRGLRPYEEKDRDSLFGRDVDFTLMRERLLAGRTTLLFAASGVGKTSFLGARFLPFIEHEFVTCHHRGWADEPPLAAVCRTLAKALGPTFHDSGSLIEALKGFQREAPASVDLDKPLPRRRPETRARELVLVLDQFEEVFQYYAFRPEFTLFLDELCALINEHSMGVRVVISMRDDFLGRLSVFDNRIPDLFNNYFRLTSPTKKQAMEIINGTASRAARQVDPDGLRALVEDLATLRRVTPRGGASMDPEPQPGSRLARLGAAVGRPFLRAFRSIVPRREPAAQIQTVERDFVVPPYLQIVCHELWERTGPDRPFLAGYARSLNGASTAATILDTFCRQRLNGLSSGRARDLAAKAFDFLMTREGAKMAYQLGRLAEHMGVKRAELSPVLNALSDEDRRILRRFKGPDESWWFELYHDMYALILYEWKRKHQARRARRRQVRIGVSSIVVLAVVLASTDAWRHWNVIRDASEDFPERSYQELKSRLTLGGVLPFMDTFADRAWGSYWDRRAARAELAEERDRALLLRLQALAVKPTDGRAAAAALLAGDEYRGMETTFVIGGNPGAAFFSDDERWLVVGSEAGVAELWDVANGRWAATLSLRVGTQTTQRPGTLSGAAFLNDSSELLLTEPGIVQHWIGPPARPEWQRVRCISPSAGLVRNNANQIIVAMGAALRRLDDLPLDLPCRPALSRASEASSRDILNRDSYPGAVTAAATDKTRIILAASNGSRVWTALAGGDVCEWDAASLTQLGCPIRNVTRAIFHLPSGRVAVLRGDFFAKDRGTFHLYALSGTPVGPSAAIESAFDPEIGFTADGRLVYVVSSDGGRSTFDAASGVLKSEGPEEDSESDVVARGPDGRLIAHLADNGHGWLTDARKRLQTPTLRDYQSVIAFSPRGTFVVAGTDDGAVRIWRADAFTPAPADYLTADGRAAPVAVAAAAPCAVHAEGARLVVANLANGSRRTLDGGTDGSANADAMAVSDDCRLIAGISKRGSLRIWNVSSGGLVHAVAIPPTRTPALAFSGDGKRLVVYPRSVVGPGSPATAPPRPTGTVPAAAPGAFVLLDTGTGRELLRSPAPVTSGVRRIGGLQPHASFSADSRTLVFTTRGRPTEFYRAADGARLPLDEVIEGRPLANCAGLLAFSSGRGASVLKTAAPLASVPLNGSRPTQSVSFNADCTYVAAIENQGLKVYSVADGQALQPPPRRDFTAVKFHPRRRDLAVATSRDGVQLIEVGDGKVRYVGGISAIGQRTLTANAERDLVIASRFSDMGDVLMVATRRWLHRLAVSDTGLRALSSRVLSGELRDPRNVHVLDSAATRVAAAVQIGLAASRIEIVDFNAAPPAPLTGDLDAWARKLGLRIDQGEIIAAGSKR